MQSSSMILLPRMDTELVYRLTKDWIEEEASWDMLLDVK